ncbi:MAG: DUF63 family protein [Haloarculaceae archaeon]
MQVFAASATGMQVLPSGLVVPPLPYVLALGALTAAAVAALYAVDPAVTDRHVLALSPWMVVGGAIHAFYQYGLVPPVLRPLAAAPAVYVTAFVLTAAAWVVAVAAADRAAPDGRDGDRVARLLGVAGGVVVLAALAGAYWHAFGRVETRALAWLPLTAAAAALVTAPTYYLLRDRRPNAVAAVGAGAAVAVFAHSLDGVSTALGVDVIETGERSPIPRRIMDFAGSLPTAPYVGTGWLFVLAKLAVVSVLVVLLADYVEERPREGNLLVAFVAAVGMGPAANNLFLFLLAGSAA